MRLNQRDGYRSLFLLLFVGALLPWDGRPRAAETGDFDGDGRLSIADYFHLEDGGEPAAGSLAAFADHACGVEGDHWAASDVGNFRDYAVLLESFRRNAAAPMPHFYDIWPDGARNEPLEPGGRALVAIEPATAGGGGSDRVRIGFELTFLAPARGFVLMLEADGDILRVPLWREDREDPVSPRDFNDRRTFDNRSWWDSRSWFAGPRLGEYRHAVGDFPVAVTHPAYLATGGKLVMTYGLRTENGHVSLEYHDIEIGEYRVEVEARLPIGTPPGSYALRVLPGSEVAFLDGTVEAFAIDGPQELIVDRAVDVGWDGGVPPLEFDLDNRRVLGSVEVRLAKADGAVPLPDQPIAEGKTGDEIEFRVQYRTTVPLNYLMAKVEWPTRALECIQDGRQYLYVNPEDGVSYQPDRRPSCADGFSGFTAGESRATFRLRGGSLNFDNPTVYWSRPLEYFRPLGEWVDLAEIRLRIPASAETGEEIPLTFNREGSQGFRYVPGYTPYAQDLPCAPYRGGEEFVASNWTYDDVAYSDSFVRVTGGEPSPPPPDAGVVVTIGDAEGRPGDLVEVPIIARAEMPISFLRLVVALDPGEVLVERLDMDAQGPFTESWVVETPPGASSGVNDPVCLELLRDDPLRELCGSEMPFAIRYHDTGPDVAFIDIFAPAVDEEAREIGRLQVRLLETGSAAEATISKTGIRIDNQGFPEDVESGAGILEDPSETFSPAREVHPATITISGRGFRRGDANGDDLVDLSDAVTTLNFLFSGGAPPTCADGADADDNGALEITDAIFHLGVLFLGTGTFPPPDISCGRDPTTDALGCRQACSHE